MTCIDSYVARSERHGSFFDMADVFISYSTSNRKDAEAFAQALRLRGWSVFWDQMVRTGETWRDVISKELDSAKCVVVLWSKAAIESHWVMEEAEIGRSRNQLVPLRIDDVLPPLGFRSFQAADLSRWDGNTLDTNLARVFEGIEAIIGPPLSQEKPKETSSGKRLIKDTECPDEAIELRLHCRFHAAGDHLAAGFSPDGRTFVTSCCDARLCLWDSFSSELRYVKTSHSTPIRTLAFHPLRALLVSATDKKGILVSDFFRGMSVVKKLDGFRKPVTALAFDPVSGILAAADSGGTISLWDITTADCLRSLETGHGVVHSLTFHKNGELISGGCDREIRLWDLKTGKCSRSVRVPSSPIYSLALTQNRLVACGRDLQIFTWDTSSWERDSLVGRHQRAILSVAVSVDGRFLASGSADGAVVLWDLQRGQRIDTLIRVLGAIQNVEFSPDGRLLAATSSCGTVLVWCFAIAQRYSPRYLKRSTGTWNLQ